jgi:hypothetical protein
LQAEFPDLALTWLDTAESEGEVFFVEAAALPNAAPRGKRASRSR